MLTSLKINLIYAFIDQNIDTSSFPSSSNIVCYTNDVCTEGEDNQTEVFNFNDCCGEFVFTSYYRIDNGPCSPCKLFLVTNDCTSLDTYNSFIDSCTGTQLHSYHLMNKDTVTYIYIYSESLCHYPLIFMQCKTVCSCEKSLL